MSKDGRITQAIICEKVEVGLKLFFNDVSVHACDGETLYPSAWTLRISAKAANGSTYAMCHVFTRQDMEFRSIGHIVEQVITTFTRDAATHMAEYIIAPYEKEPRRARFGA